MHFLSGFHIIRSAPIHSKWTVCVCVCSMCLCMLWLTRNVITNKISSFSPIFKLYTCTKLNTFCIYARLSRRDKRVFPHFALFRFAHYVGISILCICFVAMPPVIVVVIVIPAHTFWMLKLYTPYKLLCHRRSSFHLCALMAIRFSQPIEIDNTAESQCDDDSSHTFFSQLTCHLFLLLQTNKHTPCTEWYVDFAAAMVHPGGIYAKYSFDVTIQICTKSV